MRVVLADAQPQPAGDVRRILLGEGLTCDVEDVVSYEGLSGRLAAVQPDLVLVSCNGAREEAFAAIRLAHQLTDAPILATGEPEVAVVRDALRAGASEFLEAGKLREDLSAALVNIESRDMAASKRGRILSLFSPIGGAGVSTVAVNLAISLAIAAKKSGENVALVDLNAAPSDLSLLLDLEPKHTVADVCHQWERLDRRMLSGAMVEHASGLHVLAQAGYTEGRAAAEPEITREAIRQLFVLLQRTYSLVVVDMAHELNEVQVEGMQHSSFLGLVVRPDVPGLRRTRWTLHVLAEMGVPRDRFQVVLNCYGGRQQIKPAKVEEVLDMKVLRAIPENAPLMTRARNEGAPAAWLSRMGAVSSSFSALAQDVQAYAKGVGVMA